MQLIRGVVARATQVSRSCKLCGVGAHVVDKCPKVAKIHIYIKHLLTYFVRYSLGFPHFSVYICLSYIFC
jgi:hypothetical protein